MEGSKFNYFLLKILEIICKVEYKIKINGQTFCESNNRYNSN